MVKGTRLRSPHQLIQAAVTHVTSRRVIEGLPFDPMLLPQLIRVQSFSSALAEQSVHPDHAHSLEDERPGKTPATPLARASSRREARYDSLFEVNGGDERPV